MQGALCNFATFRHLDKVEEQWLPEEKLLEDVHAK